MKSLIIAALMLLSVSAVAADNIYEGRGNIYKTPATLADLQSEATRLNTYTHGNSVAIKIHDGQIKDLQQTKVDRTEFVKDQQRQDAAQKDTAGKVDGLAARADSSDLALIRETSRNDSQDVRLNGHDQQLANQDAVNAAVASSLAGMYTDMGGLRSEVRKASREAKEAKAGAAVALAVAAQQFSTDRSAGFQTAVSAATIGGYQALAVGAGGAITDTVFLNAAVSKASNQTGAAVSLTKRW
ncbi:hypothetical protein POR1_52 [Pseudomonas phage POR1]|uniref:Uncharacterized protein n=1 Tax=Pseudomonas phage POR1 TaxID=1718594 RepID=A0A0N7GFC9_9CAUD|nr:hypothetical protein POR1_52 [Pseudomonas phage POR1]